MPTATIAFREIALENERKGEPVLSAVWSTDAIGNGRLALREDKLETVAVSHFHFDAVVDAHCWPFDNVGP